MAILEVRDLQTQFPATEGLVRAVDGVSFTIESSETLALVGESGCGKSATARSLIRLVPPPGEIAGGEVFLDGRDVLQMPGKEIKAVRGREIAMIFQDPMASLNPVLTVNQQISEATRLHLGLDKRSARSRTLDLLKMVGIPDPVARLDAYPHQLSGGMRQRVMIAMALSCEPKVILADEITTALDVTIQAQILELLKSLAHKSGVALLVITHDLGIVSGMAERVHIMYAGEVVEKAATGELFANPRMPYTWGLLRSSPSLERDRTKRLLPIEGMPPDAAAFPKGCRFEPRCPYSRDICREQKPPIAPLNGSGQGHEVRCWGMQDVPGGGWLREVDWRREVAGEGLILEIRPSHTDERPGQSGEENQSVGSPAHLSQGGGHPGSAEIAGTQLLDVQGLTMHFSRTKGLFGRTQGVARAVDGVDLHLDRGETLGLVGESGSGKSTTGLSILRVHQPTSGSVKLDGVEVTTLDDESMRKMRRRMQMIFQDPYSSLDPRMTVGEIISEPIDVHRLKQGNDRVERVRELLSTVGLSPKFMDRYPHEFSGGQLQRIGIARALAVEPEFIVADEPVSALDVSIQAQVVNLLEELQDAFRLGYLFIAHDLAIVRHISDRVAVMYLGRIVELADCDDLYSEPLHPYTRALLSAVPRLNPKEELRRERIILQGDVPSPENPPQGCRFHTRCQLREELGGPEVCSAVAPDFVEYSTGHFAACHFVDA